MQTQEPQSTQPPTDQGEMPAEEAVTKWPKVIGVVSLFYAIGGLLCQVGAVAMIFLMGWFASLGGFKLELPLSVKLIGVGLAVLSFCVGLLMVVGAVGDVDGDGAMDLVVHFRVGDLGFDCTLEETFIDLVGVTFAGAQFLGYEAIRLVEIK